ncbi:MAG: TetR/AcrR family transcriptional regulator [Pseudomonadota bacterium]|nr:TetR/AcrR family transcriptional regulator [Pseudomonadota bacterium]
MARARPIDPDSRRAQLVSAARQVFATKGYHAAGVADIIDGAGVARGTFYNYFESKRAIFQAVLNELMEGVVDAVAPIDVTRPVAPQVRDNLHGVVSMLLEMGDGARILFTDAAGIDAEGMETLGEFYGAATGRIERALRTGQDLGLVRECDVGLMASCLLGLLKEPVYQGLLRRRVFDADGLVDTIFSLVGGGLMRPPDAAA